MPRFGAYLPGRPGEPVVGRSPLSKARPFRPSRTWPFPRYDFGLLLLSAAFYKLRARSTPGLPAAPCSARRISPRDFQTEIFNHRDSCDGKKLHFFYNEILSALTDAERSEFLSVVSDVLTSADDTATIIFVRQVLPNSIWRQLDELARIRVETKMLNSATAGRWEKSISQCIEGSLGTWLSGIHNEITVKDELWRVIQSKLRGSEE